MILIILDTTTLHCVSLTLSYEVNVYSNANIKRL